MTVGECVRRVLHSSGSSRLDPRFCSSSLASALGRGPTARRASASGAEPEPPQVTAQAAPGAARLGRDLIEEAPLVALASGVRSERQRRSFFLRLHS
jgi:hypothetical protein